MRTYADYLNTFTVKTLREIVARLGYKGTSKFLKAKLVEIVDMEAGYAHEDASEINGNGTFTRVEITDPALLALAAADIIDADADNDFQHYVSDMDNVKISRVRYVDMGYNMRDYIIREAYAAQNGVRDRLTPAQRRRLAKRENKQYGYLNAQLSK